MDNVALLIPVYNEGTVIKSTIDGISRKFKHIICVDDGSTDTSVEQIKKTRAVVVSHAVNLGQGASLQTAIEFALQNKALKYFITFDADGQHRLADAEKMLKILKSKKLDIVLGSRFLGGAVNMSLPKRLTLKAAVFYTNITTGLKLTDTHNGLRVFSRQTAEKLNIQQPDFAHASEIIERIKELKLKYQEAPVVINYTDYSKRKGQSIINAINIAFDVFVQKVSKK